MTVSISLSVLALFAALGALFYGLRLRKRETSRWMFARLRRDEVLLGAKEAVYRGAGGARAKAAGLLALTPGALHFFPFRGCEEMAIPLKDIVETGARELPLGPKWVSVSVLEVRCGGGRHIWSHLDAAAWSGRISEAKGAGGGPSLPEGVLPP
jgi:hypothetical protein